jgi:uncharacterized protein (DUF1800 family)
MSLLAPVTRPLDAAQATHLLRRATFGPNAAQIRQFTGMSAENAVNLLLADLSTPAHPPHPNGGGEWHGNPFSNNDEGQRINSLKGWWTGLMAAPEPNVREKMVLFWQNHFVSTFDVVNDARFMYLQNQLMRRHALGNFRQFVIDITKDAAMLIYLNGNGNVAGRPNQNYARELQELFTIGRGNYTEDDVQAAARVLTGWRVTGYRNETTGAINLTFNAAQHDTANKQFSASYQNRVIQGRRDANAGDTELGELVDMILAQPEAARFICRKLYRWFVNYDITAQIEQEFIRPLADLFRQQQFNLKPVLAALFRSQHFYDAAVRGAIIRSPMELVIGTLRAFNQNPPEVTNVAPFFQYNNYVWQRSRELQMDLMDQPTVFGWRPYYDTGFYDIWISSTTLALRNSFSDQMVTGNIRVGANRLGVDSIAAAQAAVDPSDAEKLVDHFDNLLLAVDLTKAQKDFLIDTIMVNNLPRYEWTNEWNEFTRNPNNNTRRMSVKMKLDGLLTYIFRLAEYQMC